MNAWEQVDQIASESLMHMEDALNISKLTTRDKTSDFNKTPDGYSVGGTVRIKTRPDYEAKEFVQADGVVIQAIRESKRTLTIEKHFDISVEITSREKALDFESFQEQVAKPAVYRLAEKIDTYVGTKILEAAGLYASDDLFATSADMALARAEANYQQLEPTGRFCLVNQDLESKLLGAAYFNTYNNRGTDGSTVFRTGSMGHAMGFDFFTSMQFPEQTIAEAGSGVAQTNNGTDGTEFNRVGNTVLTVDSVDLSASPINAGDRIRISGVRRPLKVSTTADGAAVTQIQLIDPITEIIPDNAAVTVVASGTTNLDIMGAIFDDQSLAMAMPILDKPSDRPSFVVSSNGFSLRVVTGYDMKYKKEMMSIDCLVGANAYDPRRITLLANY